MPRLVFWNRLASLNIARDKLHVDERLQSLAILRYAKRMQQQQIHVDRHARRVKYFATPSLMVWVQTAPPKTT